jgi:hypothetical protein
MASEPTARTRLTALVARSGHEIVEVTAGPDATLTDYAIDDPIPAPAVVIGSVEGGFSGTLQSDATDEQIAAALHAVAVGLTVHGPHPQSQVLDHCPRRGGRY